MSEVGKLIGCCITHCVLVQFSVVTERSAER